MTEQVEAFDGPPTAGWRQAHKGTLWPCRPWSACGAAPTKSPRNGHGSRGSTSSSRKGTVGWPPPADRWFFY